MNFIRAIFVLIFIAMTVVQYNDPDPFYWIAVYLLAAFIVSNRIFKRAYPNLSLITYGMILAGLIIAAPGFIDYLMSGDLASILTKTMAEKPYIEFGREFLGLCIVALGLRFSR